MELNAKEKRKKMYIGSGKSMWIFIDYIFIDISCKLNTQNARNIVEEYPYRVLCQLI